jgi:hypothetical protein
LRHRTHHRGTVVGFQMIQNITDSSFRLEHHVVVVREAAIDSYIFVRVESCWQGGLVKYNSPIGFRVHVRKGSSMI